MKLILKSIIIIFLSFAFTACNSSEKIPLKNATGKTKHLTKKELLSYNRIYEGIFINNIELKDLTKDEAINILKKSISTKDEFLVKYDGYKKIIPAKDIDFKLNFEEAVNEAFNIGRIGNNDDRMAILENLLTNPKNITLSSNINEEKLRNVINEICNDIEKKPVDDQLIFNDNVKIIEGNDGIEVDKEKLISNFKNNNFEIEIPTKISKHKNVDKKLADSIKGVIGESTTYYNSSDTNRSTNLSIASKILNNIIVMPGEIFSFTKYVNNITEENGYKPASTFLADREVSGVGGGICQISSTLYNSALSADMEIIERNQHSLRVYYVPFGLDAMIYEGSSDFKFKNNFDFPIVIISKVENGKVSFKILGDNSKKNYKVSVYSGPITIIPMPVEKIKDDSLPEGQIKIIQKGHDGLKGSSYIKKGNSEPKVLNSDNYYPKKQIIKIGTKKEN